MSAERPPSAPEHADNRGLRAFAEDALGSDVDIEDVSRGVGRLSIVWRLAAADGSVCYLKHHESRMLFDREDRAYAAWLPHLRKVPATHVPEVVARSEPLEALILTSLPAATPVPEITDQRTLAQAFRRAGRFLRCLHDLPLVEAAPDPIEHMRALIDRYVRGHAAAFDTRTIDGILADLDDGRPFAGAAFVCAHRDYSPRNWVLTEDGTLGVFDWERAQGDLWLADVTRMEFDVWHEQPALRDAFFAGYGRALTTHDREQVRLSMLIHAVASAGWAAQRGDAHFEGLARAVIARLRAES